MLAACYGILGGFICDSEVEAKAHQQANSTGFTGGYYYDPVFTETGILTMAGGPHAGRKYRGRWECRRSNGTNMKVGCGSSPGHAYWWVGPSSQECEARNTDPAQTPGPGLYLDSQVGDRCIGGCILTIVGNPIEVVQGRVQGQPANFYRFAREYSGETCDGTEPPSDTELIPTDEGPECNASLGVCVTPDGRTDYCTFNPDGTPSSCVPAEDFDNDGILDEDDPDPSDPQDSNDSGEGDEKDNVASGGASCRTAPSCTGDGIACAQLYQQWKTRCAIEALEIAVNVDIPPGEYQEIQAGDLGDPNDFGDAGITAADAWRPEGSNGGTGNGPPLDTSGWLSSRSCPVIPAVTTSIMGNSVTLDFNHPDLCWWLSIGAQLVLVFAALASIRIYAQVI